MALLQLLPLWYHKVSKNNSSMFVLRSSGKLALFVFWTTLFSWAYFGVSWDDHGRRQHQDPVIVVVKPTTQHNNNYNARTNGGRNDDGHNLALIIGNGRTGTNWLGDILLRHVNVTGANERKPEFQLVTKLAVSMPLLDDETFDRQFQAVVQQYKLRSQETAQLAPSTKLYHSDKSHPALFFGKRLRDALPAARFIGINRCVYPTVASCVRHPGVRAWFTKRHLWQRPNKFLGLTPRHLTNYTQLSVHVQCALRWASHQLEYERFQTQLNFDNVDSSSENALLMMDYRMLSLNPQAELQRLQHFLQLPTAFGDADGHAFDGQAWKTKMTPAQRQEIDTELQEMGFSRLVTTYCHASEL